jgi:biopolymer transport protein ExbB/TolQ
MELSLLEIWQSMGLLARLVAIALVAMGFASLVVAIERLMVMRKAERVSAEFARRARPLLEERDVDSLLDMTRGKEFASIPLPRLLRFGLEAFKANRKDESVGPVEMARRELGRRLEQLGAESRRGMGILASTGSTAPFIGLFGTVIGIMNSFREIAAQGETNLTVVAPGIAEALFATGLGLFAAIPALIFYNKFSSDVNAFSERLANFASEVTVRLSRRMHERRDA